jgi:hypothetical protein
MSSFRETTQLISQRYLGGEELLYPDSVRRLEATLTALAGLRETYNHILDSRPPESDDDFVRWLAENSDPGKVEPSPPAEPEPDVRPRTRAAARCLAKHFILMARAEALDDLGERGAGIRLVQEWMQSEEGQQGR